jgi:hypothetical protein
VLATVDGALAEVELDDAVITGERFSRQRVEHSSGDPLVATASHRGVRDPIAGQALRVHPRAAGDEPDEDRVKAVPVRHPRAVTAQRVLIGWGQRQEGLDRSPDRVNHERVESAHDSQVPPHGRWAWVAPGIKTGPSQRPVDGHLSARPLSLEAPMS